MLSTRRVPPWFLTFLALPALLALAGCSERPIPAAAEPEVSPTPAATSRTEQEIWDALYIRGSRAGYNYTKVSREDRGGQSLIKIEGTARLVLLREQQRTEQETSFTSLETLDGKLLEVRSEIRSGPVPMRTTGRVEGHTLYLTTATAGKTLTSTTAWSDQYGGPYATEMSLHRRPMQPGEHRSVKSLMLGTNEVTTTELTAAGYESVKLRTGTFDLLRVEAKVQLSGTVTLPMTLWLNRTGEALKSHSSWMELESYRVTKAEALDEKDIGKLDLTANLSVQLAQPLRLGHQSKRIRYRVTLDGSDPAAVFPSGPSQQVKSIDPHTALVTVYALRPGQPGGNPAAVDDPPGPDDLQPNNMIQSDHPLIVDLARQAAGNQHDPWSTALALERYVHQTIHLKDFSQAFATALEVAQTHEGDCTEHSVLLVALARARGIPARAAIGLVYVARSQTMAYHMWAELYIDKRWTPMDGTLAQGGIGGAHLKLAHSTLQGASAYSSFLPVIQVCGRLKIQVEEEE